MEQQIKCECFADMGPFNCTCKWVKDNPGNIKYNCNWCGFYTASKPMCDKCFVIDQPLPYEKE